MDDNYEEMMRSLTNIKPDMTRVNSMLGDARAKLEGEWRELGSQVEEMGDYWGDHLETVGHQMGSRQGETEWSSLIGPDFLDALLSLVQILEILCSHCSVP